MIANRWNLKKQCCRYLRNGFQTSLMTKVTIWRAFGAGFVPSNSVIDRADRDENAAIEWRSHGHSNTIFILVDIFSWYAHMGLVNDTNMCAVITVNMNAFRSAYMRYNTYIYLHTPCRRCTQHFMRHFLRWYMPWPWPWRIHTHYTRVMGAN